MAIAASVDPQAATRAPAGPSDANQPGPAGPPSWEGGASWGAGQAAPGFGQAGGLGGAAPFWRGDRLIDPSVSDGDRAIAVIMHLWWVLFFAGLGFFAVLIPVILWAVRQSSSAFVDDHGREALNVQLTGLILCVSIFGLIAVPFWGILCAINSVRAAVAAGSREHFRYGVILRPLG